MNIFILSFKYLWSRPLAAGLNVLLLALGVASITFVFLVSSQIDRAFERDLKGIDVVVGAKGSPIQLILAGVFHIDTPTGNISLADMNTLQQDARVATLIPLSVGDSFRGFRIVGTTADYVTHYEAKLVTGSLFKAPLDAVIGAEVASNTSLATGSSFIGSHGLGQEGHAHGDTPYQVTGVLAHCSCVLDRLILTATESVWRVHEKALEGDTKLDADDKKAIEEDREVTLALIRYKSPLASVSFPRFVNTTTNMQAAAPAVEITRLLRMVGVGTDVLRGFGAVLLLTAGLSVFIALWNAVRERRADLAMLRMLGASPQKVAGLLVCEALWLAILASALGLLLGHLLTGAVGYLLEAEKSLPVTGWVWLVEEWAIPATAALVAVVAALLPAIAAYRVDVQSLLKS
jgi:putative ABC transport system permease protein